MREFLRPFARGYRLLLERRTAVLLGLACVPIYALAGLAMPKVVGGVVDALIAPDASGEVDARRVLRDGVLLLIGLAVADSVLRFVARKLLIDASRHAEERLKDELMRHLARLPTAWFDRARTGDLISRLTQDVELVRFVLGPLPLYGLAALVLVPGGLWIMGTLSPVTMIATVAAFAVLMAGMAFVLPRQQKASKAVQEAIAAISQRAAEDFAGIRVLMNFARLRQEANAMAGLAVAYFANAMHLTRLRALQNLLIHSAGDLVLLGLLVVGGLQVVRGELRVGELFQFLMLLGVMLWPLITTGWILALLHQAVAAARRVEEVFAQQPEAEEGLDVPLRGALEMRRVTFTYPGQSRPALADVTFRLEAGRKLGIVGPVGSGKSTLLALLMRMHEPPRGTVFVDGHDVCDLSPTALRRTFAVAPQDPFLFSDTIRGNVTFGAHDATDAEVDEAVHAAALDRDLPDLADGLRSIVGERGITLSGGQKQRVSLARALIAKRPVLVLDDTLSAVDHRTETTILERLRALPERTTIVTAHRLSAIADADLILVLRDGRVVEHGTHTELLRAAGEYAVMWRRQQEADALAPEADGPTDRGTERGGRA